MKASRFIMNTDYITTQNDSEFEIVLTVPGVFSIPRTQSKVFKTTFSSPGSASKGYRCYFTSSAYGYTMTGCVYGTIKIGGILFYIALSRKNNEFELSVSTPATTSDRNVNTQAQTITAHVQTFIDPFQA